MKAKDVNETDRTIGMKINQLRLSMGITRQEMAEQLGITHQQLQKYEKGINRISASRLADVAVILKVHVGYFFDEGKKSESLEHIERQRVCVDIIRDFVQIKSADQQDAIRRLIKTMI